jgi:hypothetical protein
MISLIGLTGCGIINPSELVLPDDIEFIELVEKLDTPLKTVIYLSENITPKANKYTSVTPYELYINKFGDCNDFATFGMFCANYHGYNTYEIIIYFLNSSLKHAIAVYEEYGGYTFSDINYYRDDPFNSFLDIVNADIEHLNSFFIDENHYKWNSYKVYDYNMNIIEEGFNAP